MEDGCMHGMYAWNDLGTPTYFTPEELSETIVGIELRNGGFHSLFVLDLALQNLEQEVEDDGPRFCHHGY